MGQKLDAARTCWKLPHRSRRIFLEQAIRSKKLAEAKRAGQSRMPDPFGKSPCRIFRAQCSSSD